MTRLPVPGGDSGTWGQVLNDFLAQSHNTDGTVKSGAIGVAALQDGTVTQPKLSASGGTNGQVLSTDGTNLVWSTPASGAGDATTSSKGIVQLAGDLAGTAASPTVPGLASKEPTIAAGTTSQYYRGDKSWQTLDKAAVGLSNADNTSDAAKNSASVTLTNKTISGASNTLSNIPESAVTNLTTDLASKISANSPVTGATKTKLTYDSKGLITAGTDATQDDIGDGTTYKQYSATEKTKLAGIATGATANDTDANLKNRANHTGTQLLATISDVIASATEVNFLDGVTSAVQGQLDGKQASLTLTTTGSSGTATFIGNTLNIPQYSNGNSPYVTVGFANADYIVDGTDDDVQIQAAIDALAAGNGGTVFLKSGGYSIDTLVLKDTVSLIGESQRTVVLTLEASAGTGIIGEDFATAAGSGDASAGISQFSIQNLTIQGNSANQTDSAAADYRDRNALIKLYGWGFNIRNVRLNDAKELALYTEHDNDWNGENFNEYQFGESVFENVYIKNYGKAGWINRGPHDSHIKSAYISSYNASGLNAQYGYIGQVNGGAHYGSQGTIADNLHVWGEHSANAILLDGANIIQGKVYAEGAVGSAIKIQSSSKNHFEAFVGYAVNGVELASVNDNDIAVAIESNIAESAFKLTGTSAGNYCRHITGTPSGGSNPCIFWLASYTGGDNGFVTGRPWEATLFTGTPSTNDRIDAVSDTYPEAGRVTRWELPVADTKVKISGSGMDLGSLKVLNVAAGASSTDGVNKGQMDTALSTKADSLYTINAQTGTSYTLVAGDAGKFITLTNASAISVTVPPNSSVAFAVGTRIAFAQMGAGQVTFVAGGGVSLFADPGLKIAAQYGGAEVVKLATDTWVLVGRLSA